MLNARLLQGTLGGDDVDLIGPGAAVGLATGAGGANAARGFIAADVFGGIAIGGINLVFYFHYVYLLAAAGHDVDFAPAVAPVAANNLSAGGFEVIGRQLLGGAANLNRGHD